MYQHNNVNAIFTPLNHLPQELRRPRLREEVLQQIHGDPQATYDFRRLNDESREALLQFCMGNRGLQITYDPFFHKIFDAERHPERLNRLLSAILNQPIKVVKVLPREGDRLTENASLVIMDTLVQLTDGTLINVEIQRTGYNFPVHRSFCYGADLLSRQYANLKASRKNDFNYRDMCPVYVIVLMEKSPQIFKKYPDSFIHRSQFTFDTGLALDNLLNFVYIPLDIFRQMPHNEINELEAWMYFIASDEPHHIKQIVEKYPFFQELYHEIINFRYHPKELISMYSEALAIMDRNTVKLMIDEMKEECESLTKEKSQMETEISHMKTEISQMETKFLQSEADKSQLADENARLRAQLDALLKTTSSGINTPS